MKNDRKLIQFHFITNPEVSTHYHQNPEVFYVLTGELKVQIDETTFLMKQGDILLINANKRHTMNGNEELLGARFDLDFHLLAEYMESMQLLFWCNSVADKNAAYADLREVFDQILSRYFEKDEKSALDLQALYFQAAHILTSNFLVKADDTRLNMDDSQDRQRVRQIQNYIQANYQSQISLNNLADQLYLSNAYLSKYVKKHLGLTFMEYLNNVRLFHAVDELLYTKKNMTHIALDNGFPTSATFTKAFRDIYGEAPSEYRRKMREQQEPNNPEQGLSEEESGRIKKYLIFKEQHNEPVVKNQKVCTVDVQQTGKLLTDCHKAICVGDAYTVLQSDVQSQLRDLQKAADIKYARMWNIFSREECYNEKGGCNFRKIDQILDFLLENHMKPYLELGHKEVLLNYSAEKFLKENEKIENYEVQVYEYIIREFCTHLVNRYGIDEIETWYFEYYNFSNTGVTESTGMTEEEGLYYQYFAIIYRILKGISPAIKVGGAGFILGYGTLGCRSILPIWKKKNLMPDFLSVYSYQYVAIDDNGERYGRKSIDIDYMKNQTEILREVIKETGFQVPELHMSEWNFTISNRNVLNDSCNQGAYVLKNCIDMNGEVDLMAYWHALDSYSDYYDADNVLNGDSGMISRDGIRKPSFYAYVFMNRLLPNVIKKDENSIITTNGRDRYVIACHNFKKLSAQYVFSEEEKITVETIDNYMENDESLKLQFRLENVKDGDYLVKIHMVNKENGSAQDIWKRLQCSKNLARDEMQYLEKSAIPRMEMKNVHVEGGVLELENVLMAQEIRLLDIQYRYSLK
ncbi:helix-turn-helix domain-containing protein [Mediterraneibacter faecis]|uniref:GH39 family glycosyl hydrolase n=1 Tax=Mediterraneibacter faecis TaxID=592978 RepID=UPI001EDE0F11|nr:helix-turn-helix domain-containing protein [Mediterraneibacter faecis]MCG4531939.1 helix-turn-helix domain-containing protein [Mediterraneibacter faecis]MCG4537478.1 helix-turn-helix domain-containing protein [Mediterraneibacter faecis]MCG4540263.1 helix-turn-helix domain-containing protein [Mediterraneibacter faecis]MCG4549074.1 helix-turn-helix domain-containing protein [Mediterraneibacter faecis]MCG4551768.1 helix-turn-helix domain-containing protein [Mediterraneibacter faecis]